MREGNRRLIAIVTVILSAWALRATTPVTLPLAFALLAIAAVWPLKEWLSRWMPDWASLLLSIFVLLLVILAFALALWVSAAQILSELQAEGGALNQAYGELASIARSHGFMLSQHLDGAGTMLRRIALDGYRVTSFVGFVVILVIFALPEVQRMTEVLGKRLTSDADQRLRTSAREIARKVRRYLAVTFVLSVITGLLCWGWAYAMGLQLAITWGLLNFLLNFVPIVGNIIGIIPPSLYAFAQFGGGSHAILTAAGFAVIQLIVSNFLNPWMEGRTLSLSPLAIIIAIALWSWLWGVGGALLAVPITSASAIILRSFEQTRWIAALIAPERRAST